MASGLQAHTVGGRLPLPAYASLRLGELCHFPGGTGKSFRGMKEQTHPRGSPLVTPDLEAKSSDKAMQMGADEA